MIKINDDLHSVTVDVEHPEYELSTEISFEYAVIATVSPHSTWVSSTTMSER